MQDGHYAYVSIGEPSPVDEVPFVGQKETVYTELRRYGAGWNAACFDPGEGVKQSIDMAVCLLDPQRACVWRQLSSSRRAAASRMRTAAMCSGPIACNDISRRQGPIGRLRRIECLHQFSLETLQPLLIHSLHIAADQIPDVFAGVLAGTVFSSAGGQEVAQ